MLDKIVISSFVSNLTKVASNKRILDKLAGTMERK